MAIGRDLDLAGQIKSAVGAHAMWKQKLKTAIHSGTSAVSLDDARRDDKCEFGKWLNGAAQLRMSSYHARVKELHRKFHAEVGNVLQIALKGDRVKAEAMLEPGSAFASASLELTTAMMMWSREKP